MYRIMFDSSRKKIPSHNTAGRVLQKSSIFIYLLILFICSATLWAQNSTGKLVGKVVDSETGEDLIGANVYFEGTTLGAASDLDGTFFIDNIPPANYTLIVQMISYAVLNITDVNIVAGQTEKLELILKPEALTTEEVVVEAKMMKNNEASLLKVRQRSSAVSDAISAEAISRSGSGNAAEAMKQVTGASVVDGKYVFVRGLGDRYTSTQLNGAEIPSTDPYKRSGSIDLIPSNLVDNIVTIKSFTPDKPGNFSGGTVDIQTKDFPEELSIKLSVSSSYNSQVNASNKGPLGYTGGKTDWLGMDDGIRDIPEVVRPEDVYIPNVGEGAKDLEVAREIDEFSKAFTGQMTPKRKSYPMNQGYSLSIGNQKSVMGRPLGYIASLSYSHSYSSYNDSQLKRWYLGSAQQTTLTNDFDLIDTKTSDEVLWGALVKLSYKLTPNHVLTLDGLYNQNGESVSRHLEGKYPYDLDPTSTFFTDGLSYHERNIKSLQLKGEHQFSFLNHPRISWKASLAGTKQDEPDYRYFSSFQNKRGLYGIKTNLPPSRYYRFMDETRQEFNLDLSLPFKQWSGLSGSVKIGGLVANVERDFHQRLFEYRNIGPYNGNADSLFSPTNVGLVDTSIIQWQGQEFKTYVFGPMIGETYDPAAIYNGTQNILATYGMIDVPIFYWLRFVGGARFERTEMTLTTEKKDIKPSDIKNNDLLPSVNFINNIYKDMNIRTSYSRTLARPVFREIAPYASYEFMGGDVFIGNENLKRTLIDNFDLRWEWFARPGEIYAVSLFYKQFSNPIELTIINQNHHLKWKNVDQARAFGMEFELRKRLDFMGGLFKHLMFGGNLALIDSKVDIDETELNTIRRTRLDAPDTREFANQSPYILNLNLTYDHFEKGIAASVYYNIFGKRLSVVSLGGAPDVYEQPAGLLNVSLSWKLINHISFKFDVKNLLDENTKLTQTYLGTEYIYHQYHRGRVYSVGLGYSM
jgi:outer membrane receptor protein involved in Fe transport